MELRDKNGLTEKEFLEKYRPGDYERPSVAVDTVIFTATQSDSDNYRRLPEKSLKILLIRRGGHPYLGQWALPGGFAEPHESTEQAAKRELLEETGVDGIYLEQLYTFSEPDRDPRMRVMSCSYMALADSSKIQLSAGDDAQCAEWFNISLKKTYENSNETDNGIEYSEEYSLTLEKDDIKLSAALKHIIKKSCRGTEDILDIISSDGIAFDHAKIITFALIRLRGKILYSDIALNLMPEEFTLTEFQQVYEIILDRQLLKAPFRRKFGVLAEETDSVKKDAGHRPSRLFRKKWLNGTVL